MSLFPTLQKLSPRATLLYDCFPGMLTKQAPSEFAYGAANAAYYQRNGGPCPNDAAVFCWQQFTGTDPITEFEYPSYSPLFAYTGSGSNKGFGAYLTDQYYGFGNPGTQAGVDASTGITTQTSTVRGVPIQTLKINQYNHVQNGFQSGVQTHWILYRDLLAPGFVDLMRCCIYQVVKFPDHSALLSQTYRYRAIHEWKTFNDFRMGVMIIMANAADAAEFGCAAGKLGFMLYVDNNISTSPQVEYIRMKNFDVDVPTDFFESYWYWQRAANYDDLDTGRIVFRINSPTVGDHIVFDVNADSVAQYNIDHPLQCTNQPVPSNCINRGMGVSGHAINRIFTTENYHGGVGGVDVQFELARLQFWDDAPFALPLPNSPSVYQNRSDAPFYWPLRGSIALQNGSGTPTFTRATAKWMFNDEGKLIKLPSGAIEMRGYRPVINLAGQCSPPSSENFSTGWVKNGVTTPSANTMLVDGTTNPKYILINTSPTFTAGLIYCATYRVQYVDIQYIQLVGQIGAFGTGIYCNFDLINGTSNPTGCTATITAVSSGVWDVSITATATTTAANAAIAIALVPALSSARLANFVGDSVKSLGVLRYQIEDVTGQAVRTSSEYVSFGILSAPYHGAGVDGVKYFATHKDGTAIPESSLVGAWLNPSSTTNNLLYCRDLTNAVWVKTNVTPTLNQTGIDGQANASSLLTATANNATVLQSITAASAAGCSGFYVKRSAGTGSVYFTRDGGTNWTDITSLINSSTYTLVKIENTSVTNPQVGFKIATSSDAIIVDAGINHLGTELANPILTTTAAVTVGNDPLTAPTSGNISDTAGTILATVTRDTWVTGNGSAVGSATCGLYTSSTNSGAQGLDGTNTVNGPSGTPSGETIIGMRWSGTSMQVYSDGTFGSVGSYDGSFNLSTIAAMAGVRGGIKDIGIWPTQLTQDEMRAAANNI